MRRNESTTGCPFRPSPTTVRTRIIGIPVPPTDLRSHTGSTCPYLLFMSHCDATTMRFVLPVEPSSGVHSPVIVRIVSLCVAGFLLVACAEEADHLEDGTPSSQQSDRRPTQVVIDSDANNELDDQHAIAYALLSTDDFDVEGITVNRTANGGDIDAQAEEARRIVRLVGLEGEIPVLNGASGSYREIAPTVNEETFDGAEAVEFLIEKAHASGERPLHVIPIGKLTNVALALEKDPSIASEIRVVWLGSNFPDPGEYNLENDPSAVNPVLESSVPFEIAVVRYDRFSGTAAVQAFQPEIQERMPGLGPQIEEPVTGRHGGKHRTFGDYSVALFDHVDQHARALYDVAAVAVVKNPEWAVRQNVEPYRLEDGEWVRDEAGHDVVIWELFYTSKILDDFFATIDTTEPSGGR